jgi:glutamate racemase
VRTEISQDSPFQHLPYAASPRLLPASLLDARGSPVSSLLGPSVMPRAIPTPTILMFDTGLGGLTVFREVVRARPDAAFVYAADDALFPYGRLADTEVVARVLSLMERFIAQHRPDLVVIACNTASTIVLPALRQHFAVPFVGTVPAIKPACASSASKLVSVLGTEATVRREYTHALIRQYGQDCGVTLVGSARLAAHAESEMAGKPVADELLAAEIAPCFVEKDGRRTDTVVLACTHYPLLTERLERIAPWPVRWLDPAPAIARRVLELVGAPPERALPVAARMVFTSGKEPSSALAAALAGFGIGASEPASA